MTTQDTPFYLYKGDDAVFDGINKIQITINSETTDLSRFSVLFELGDFKQITNLKSGVVKIELTREQSSKFLYGPMKGIIRLIDERGHIKTIVNYLDFFITNDLSLLEHNKDLILDGIIVDDEIYRVLVNFEVPLTQYDDLEGKPVINGEEVRGDKTGEDYGLQNKLTAASNIDINENNVIIVKTTSAVEENNELPVQSGAVYDALADMGFDISELNNSLEVHKQDISNPHQVTKEQVGLGNVDNTSDLAKPISTATQTALNAKQDTLTSTQQQAINSGITSMEVAQIETNTNGVSGINAKIPTQASAENQLADKNFVNSSINAVAAYYITSDIAGDPFATVADLDAGPYFSQGSSREPTRNDYALVTADENHDGKTSRYLYDGSQWVWQYDLNNTTFTAAQVAAINSGVTSAKVAQIDTNASNITALQTASANNYTKTNLTSGTNISITPSQADPNVFEVNNTQDISGLTTDVTDLKANALKNTATGANALTILGTPATVSDALNVGKRSSARNISAIAIGGANAGGQSSVAIGAYTFTSGLKSIAIGGQSIGARANASETIQLGEGTNSTAKTLQVYEYQLLDGNTGLIPGARIPYATSTTKGGIRAEFDDTTNTLNIFTED